MKRAISLLLIGILLLALAACSPREDAPETQDDDTAGEGTQSPEPEPEPEEQPLYPVPDGVEVYRPAGTLGGQAEAIVQGFDEFLEGYGFPKTSTLPVETGETAIEGQGVYRTRTYEIGEGASLLFSETLDRGEVFSVVCLGLAEEMDGDTQDALNCYILAILHLFSQNPQEVLDQLNLEQTEFNFAMVTDGDVSFNYMANGGTFSLSADPS